MKRYRRDTVLVACDQLMLASSALEGASPYATNVLLVESTSRAAARPCHKQELGLASLAMRHFAEELRRAGYDVDYYELAPSFGHDLEKHLEKYRPTRVRLMESAE